MGGRSGDPRRGQASTSSAQEASTSGRGSGETRQGGTGGHGSRRLAERTRAAAEERQLRGPVSGGGDVKGYYTADVKGVSADNKDY
eukprot:393128-Prorocentrum_minimum.AAC.1